MPSLAVPVPSAENVHLIFLLCLAFTLQSHPRTALPWSPGPRELPAAVLVQGGLPCGGFLLGLLVADPPGQQASPSTAQSLGKMRGSSGRRTEPAGGDGFGSRTRPKPNSKPGRRGRAGEEEKGLSLMRLQEGMPCSGAPPELHWKLISPPGDVALARTLPAKSSC